MGRFYETTFYDSIALSERRGRSVVGWQLLASPPVINGRRIPYEELMSDFGRREPVDAFGLVTALQFIGDPSSPWTASEEFRVPSPPREPLLDAEPHRARVVHKQVELLLETQVFAAEMSPVRARSFAELAALAATSVVVGIGGLPAIVLVGEAIGLVVVRPLAAVSGALWEGARSEVVEFGADTAATLLDALRLRLGVPRRTAKTASKTR